MPRHQTRLYTSAVPSIDIRQEIRTRGKTPFAGPSVDLYYRGQKFVVYLNFMPQRLGGRRVYFVCPWCDQRSEVLYVARKRLACRPCQRLTYFSQGLGPTHRRTRRLHKARVRLGQSPDVGLTVPLPGKPKWMRWRTYERLAAEAAAGERAHMAAAPSPAVAKLLARLQG